MLNDETASIRYLMKEMDPSEELLMERAMMEDDDLLIEVESLRQTLQRLDKLPEVSPPDHLTESVINEAAEYRKQQRSSFLNSLMSFKYVAAAVLVLGVSVGSFLVIQELDSKDAIPADTKAASQMRSPVKVISVINTSDNEAPWIDRDNIIHIRDQYEDGNTEFDSMLESTTNKLTPLSDPFYYNSGSRSLQMTGSSTR